MVDHPQATIQQTLRTCHFLRKRLPPPQCTQNEQAALPYNPLGATSAPDGFTQFGWEIDCRGGRHEVARCSFDQVSSSRPCPCLLCFPFPRHTQLVPGSSGSSEAQSARTRRTA